MIVIYKITSPTNRIYIGQSWDMKRRVGEYKRNECKSQRRLYNSLNKHGWENHTFEICHELPEDISQEILDNYEVFYWQQYKELDFDMMNIKEPGKGGKHSEETKKKIGNSRKLFKYSQKSKDKMSKSAKKKDLFIAIKNVTKFQKPGSGNPRATLNEDQVKSIKLDNLSGIKRKDIVIKYNTSKYIIDAILSNKSWKHVNI